MASKLVTSLLSKSKAASLGGGGQQPVTTPNFLQNLINAVSKNVAITDSRYLPTTLGGSQAQTYQKERELGKAVVPSRLAGPNRGYEYTGGTYETQAPAWLQAVGNAFMEGVRTDQYRENLQSMGTTQVRQQRDMLRGLANALTRAGAAITANPISQPWSGSYYEKWTEPQNQQMPMPGYQASNPRQPQYPEYPNRPDRAAAIHQYNLSRVQQMRGGVMGGVYNDEAPRQLSLGGINPTDKAGRTWRESIFGKPISGGVKVRPKPNQNPSTIEPNYYWRDWGGWGGGGGGEGGGGSGYLDALRNYFNSLMNWSISV